MSSPAHTPSNILTHNSSQTLIWKGALLFCALVWGGSFVVIKDAINYIPTAWLMTLRFTLSVVVVGIIFKKRLKKNLDIKHLKFGALLGILNGFGFLLQNGALAYTTAGKTAFIASIYCAMIPCKKETPYLQHYCCLYVCCGNWSYLTWNRLLIFLWYRRTNGFNISNYFCICFCTYCRTFTQT